MLGLHNVENVNNFEERGKKCAIFHTVDIHYFELFQNVKIDSFIDRPIQVSYDVIQNQTANETAKVTTQTVKNKLRRNSRNLALGIQPDSPLTTCSDTSWGKHVLHSGDTSYWDVFYGGASYAKPIDLDVTFHDVVDVKVPVSYTYLVDGDPVVCASLEADIPGSI